ncbi:hypothetical protein JMJ35_003206 [Cladonia borealis]|uniref:Large ribosomal subunit protein bL17m n=1 Tax=Cladonia borealis TaxID=184061 RepID=A0AA39V6N4_9LECA|nr:hypothetical protein JMJ35_003206 [Cladonia borealis]
MAGGHQKYRHLSRNSAHRQAMLRNMVTSLITHESIRTTWHKAKEAQRLAEKLITLGKKNTNASRRRASQILFDPLDHFPKLFGTLRNRYLTRPGGYTRVLHIESLNRNHDQAPSAILELVDGPRDMRFAMTAKTLARERLTENGVRDITARNVAKVIRYRKDGEEELESLVRRMRKVNLRGEERGREAWSMGESWDREDEGRLRRVRWQKKNSRRGERDPADGRRDPRMGEEDREVPGMR